MFPKKTKMLFTCSIFSSISSSLSSQRIVATKAPSLSSVASGGGSAGFDFWAASPHTASSSLKPLSFTQNLGTSPQQAMSIACGGKLKGIIRQWSPYVRSLRVWGAGWEALAWPGPALSWLLVVQPARSRSPHLTNHPPAHTHLPTLQLTSLTYYGLVGYATFLQHLLPPLDVIHSAR